MGAVMEPSDEEYEAVERAAAERGQSPEALRAEVLTETAAGDNGAEGYETEDWFLRLGASEEQIAVAAQIAQTRSNGLYADP